MASENTEDTQDFIERRRTGREEGLPRRRRLRDRLEGGEVALSPSLQRSELLNSLLFCDDDLRQTARTLEGIESFVLQAARLLEKPDIQREEVMALLLQDVEERVDELSESLTSLQRGLRAIAAGL